MSLSPTGSPFFAPIDPVRPLPLPSGCPTAKTAILDASNQVETVEQSAPVRPQFEMVFTPMRAEDSASSRPTDDALQKVISQLNGRCKDNLAAASAEFDAGIATLNSEYEAEVLQITKRYDQLFAARLAEMEIRHTAMLAQAERDMESYRTQRGADLNSSHDALNTPQARRDLLDQDPLIAQPIFAAWNQYSAASARYQERLRSLDQNILRLQDVIANDRMVLKHEMQMALSDELHTAELNFEREKARVGAQSLVRMQAIQNQHALEIITLQDVSIQNLRHRLQDAHLLSQPVEQPSVVAAPIDLSEEIPEDELGSSAPAHETPAAAEVPTVAIALSSRLPFAALQTQEWRNRICRFLRLGTRSGNSVAAAALVGAVAIGAVSYRYHSN